MLSISKIESPSHGLDYYTKDNYYAKEEQKEYTRWFGKTAKILGLNNEVVLDDFEKMLSGNIIDQFLGFQNKKESADNYISYDEVLKFRQDLEKYIDNSSLTCASKEKIKYSINQISDKNSKLHRTHIERYQGHLFSVLNKDASIGIDEKRAIGRFLQEKIDFFAKSPSRRSGYDLTFSAPKSVSMAALLGNDNKLILAHRESVEAALKVVEDEYSQIRIRTKGKLERIIENTGNIAVAMFEHDVSRKTDPQLHTHCVLMNCTRKKNGTWRAIYPDGFFYDSKKIGLIYQNELAQRVKAIGYSIQVNSNGTFDIQGYSKEQLDQFSKRTAQLHELGAKTQKEKTRLVKIKRDKKTKPILREELQSKWQTEAKEIGITHPTKNIQKKPNLAEFSDITEHAMNSIILNSMKDATYHDVSFKISRLETDVLSKTLGNEGFDYTKIKEMISDFVSKNAIKAESNHRLDYVPFSILNQEKECIAFMQQGKNSVPEIMNHAQARQITHELHHNSLLTGHSGLNAGQKEAIEMALTSKDGIFAWQGVAGAGKSFAISAVVEAAMKQDYTVKGFAPSAEASKILATEARMSESNTLAYLLSKDSTTGKFSNNEIWIVDEAGLLSISDAHSLFKMAKYQGARVMLVGDTRQLSSVGAGNPFKQLQTNGMATAHLYHGLRQKDQILKQAVDLIAKGQHKAGFDFLDNARKIFEVKSKEDIIANMAREYLSLHESDLKNSLFVVSTNYEKDSITDMIRSALKLSGKLYESITVTTYVQFDYSNYALKHAHSYSIGNIVIPNKRGCGLDTNQPYEVIDICHRRNSVTLRHKNDSLVQKEINVAHLSCSLFREEKRDLCIGDRLKWTKNHFSEFCNSTNLSNGAVKKEKRINGQYLTLDSIDKNIGVFKYDNGRTEKVDLSKGLFLDYSYVTTIFSSQGKTCDKIYASLTSVDREKFYVAVSRAKYDCKIYTEDKTRLAKSLKTSGAKITAYEKISRNLHNDDFIPSFSIEKKQIQNRMR